MASSRTAWLTSLGFVGLVLFFAEIPLNLLIIFKVSYTEIDWKAYMQEVEGFLNGTRDYYQLKGDTGPLVYPAGFVYIYSFLYHVTDNGTMIGVAQIIFALLYVVNLLLVINIYRKASKVPWFVLAMMSLLAYRVHSIFVLRMFNDAVAMVIAYAAINAFMYSKWTLGCVLYSLAVSVKMNVLLFAPGLFVVLLLATGIKATLTRIVLCGVIQVILGVPFLLGNPLAYLMRSFEFQRQFLYKWTVNWRLLPEWLFLDRRFHLVLLLCHMTVLALFAYRVWLRGRRIYWSSFSKELSVNEIVTILFVSNFVGVVFARSLHYQFYIWYYHTLPFLIWSTELPTPIKVLLPLVVEWCWNVYPSTVASSATLHTVHFVVLSALILFNTQSYSKEQKLS